MLPPNSWAPSKDSSITSFYSSNFLDAHNNKDSKAVGAQFEAIFYRMLLGQARDAALGDEVFGSSEMEHVTEMRDNELSQHLGSIGYLGFADLLNEEASASTQGLLKSPIGGSQI